MRTQGKLGWLLAASVLLSTAALAADDAKLVRMWNGKCGSCHGADGKGKTKQGAKMGIGDITDPAWQKEWTDEKIREVAMKGFSRVKNGKQQDMEAMGKEMEPAQLDAMIKYLRVLAAKR